MLKSVVKKIQLGQPFVLSAMAGLMLLITTSTQVIAQTCESTITPTAPDSRYTDNGNGTITDKQTGLMWKQCAEGQSGSGCATGIASDFTWAAALQRPVSVNTTGGYAGYTDWRLPNIKELMTLVERTCTAPSINSTLFPIIQTQIAQFWSSSPQAYYSTFAWYIYFYDGSSDVIDRLVSIHVRLVRSGQ